MIVDALTHITRNGNWFGTGLDASFGALLNAMNRDGVDTAVLVGIPGLDDDDLILNAVRQHPGRFIPVAGVDISCRAKTLVERMEQVKSAGFAGIKLHPRLSNTPLTHPRIKQAVAQAGRLDLTAMICTIHRPPLPPLGRPVSDALYELCRECDESRIILVHGGYTDILATSELIRPLEHVLLDLSLTLTRFSRASVGLDCAWLMENLDRRVCIGSDFPEGDMGIIQTGLSRIGVDPTHALNGMAENLLRHLKTGYTP